MRDSIIEPELKQVTSHELPKTLTIEKSRVHTLPHFPLQFGQGFETEYPPHSEQSNENWFDAQHTPQLKQL